MGAAYFAAEEAVKESDVKNRAFRTLILER
jgi:hypothetical protein